MQKKATKQIFTELDAFSEGKLSLLNRDTTGNGRDLLFLISLG